MPLGRSHFRQKLTLLYFCCQENNTQTFPSGQAPPEDGTSGRQQIVQPQQSIDLPSSGTILTPWSAGYYIQIMISPNTSGLNFLNYQLWLKISVLK